MVLYKYCSCAVSSPKKYKSSSNQTRHIHLRSQQRRALIFQPDLTGSETSLISDFIEFLSYLPSSLQCFHVSFNGKNGLGAEIRARLSSVTEFRVSQEKTLAKIYLHPGGNDHTTRSTKDMKDTMLWLRGGRSPHQMKRKERRNLQVPKTGFLLFLKSWILLWSPEKENSQTQLILSGRPVQKKLPRGPTHRIISVHLTASCSSISRSLYWFLSIRTLAISTLVKRFLWAVGTSLCRWQHKHHADENYFITMC